MLTALYIHIPFCDKICIYCDFHKEMAKDSKKQRYIDALLKELGSYQNQLKDLKTVYIGGGSPTSLSNSDLIKVLQSINEVIDVDKLEEFTIEANPNNITKEKADVLYSFGVNRVSMGVQTFNDEHLQFLNREHKEEDIKESIRLLRQAGITNINIDMIFSLPNQTLNELRYDLDNVITLNPSHISYYSLIFEEKTKLYYLLEKNEVSTNSEDLEALMYNEIINSLKSNGYLHYEISNYAKEGFESKHNLVYWKNMDYLGIGSGSHSLYDNKRFFNIRNVSKYIENVFTNQSSKQHEEIEPLREEMMMGLRLIEGINVTEVENKYKINLLDTYPKLNYYIKEGLLKIENNKLSFTKTGLMLGNLVFSIF
jgi:oxygen-independent coproporphyrinogen-3 oxidase